MNERQAKTIVDNLTERQQQELQSFLMRQKPYLWIAKRLKISAVAVRNFDIIRNQKHHVSEDGYGKLSLRPFIISRRYVDANWPALDDAVIAKAREDYDAGKIELVTGRDGFYQILYRIPRQVIDTKRKPWFTRQVEDDAE